MKERTNKLTKLHSFIHSFIRSFARLVILWHQMIGGLMNAAVSALGIRMFDSRMVLQENWQPLLGGAGLSALFGLFGTGERAE